MTNVRSASAGSNGAAGASARSSVASASRTGTASAKARSVGCIPRDVRTRSGSPSTEIALATRPVLFALARTLAVAPGGAARETLIADAFGARRVNESHRARLRVEIGRLRRALAPVAEIRATADGF